MRLLAYSLVIAALVLLVAWFAAGRRLTSLVDSIVTTRTIHLPVTPIKYDGGGFKIGQEGMTFGATDNLRSNLELCPDASNRVVLGIGGKTFTLGPRTNRADPSGRPEIDFIPDPGDVLSFTSTRSTLGWPTPFEFNFMIRSPWWKRYVYYKLVWQKRDGTRLEMRWRYQQEYYSRDGWTAPLMMWNWHTGLIAVDIKR